MDTRGGTGGGTFRVREIRPRERVSLESLDQYLAGQAVAGGSDDVLVASAQRPAREAPQPKSDEIVEPKRIDVDGRKWAVARVTPGTERRIARDLADEGFDPYCPLGRKVALRARVNGSNRRQRQVRQFAVFSPYLFVGCTPSREIGREIYDRWGQRVGTVICNAGLPTFVAPHIIAEINRLEVAGQWWEDWFHQTHLRAGAQVMVIDGPFRDMRGLIESLPAEMRVTVDIRLFGGLTPVTFDACQIGLV
jgi:transcription antitermination factor NusG